MKDSEIRRRLQKEMDTIRFSPAQKANLLQQVSPKAAPDSLSLKDRWHRWWNGSVEIPAVPAFVFGAAALFFLGSQTVNLLWIDSSQAALLLYGSERSIEIIGQGVSLL